MIKVLLVDDCQAVSELVKKGLEEAKTEFKVEICNDPTLALQRLKEDKFDLFITDLNMPLLSGSTLLELKVDTLNKSTPSILISGMASSSLIRDLNKSRVSVITKPFKYEELIEQSYFLINREMAS